MAEYCCDAVVVVVLRGFEAKFCGSDGKILAIVIRLMCCWFSSRFLMVVP